MFHWLSVVQVHSKLICPLIIVQSGPGATGKEIQPWIYRMTGTQRGPVLRQTGPDGWLKTLWIFWRSAGTTMRRRPIGTFPSMPDGQYTTGTDCRGKKWAEEERRGRERWGERGKGNWKRVFSPPSSVRDVPSALMHSLSNYHSTLWYSAPFIFCRGKSRMV